MNRKLTKKLNVYLEVGIRRTFAAALDWPGWCRMGRDEATALQTLFEYGPRYARILGPSRVGMQRFRVGFFPFDDKRHMKFSGNLI